MPFPGSNIIPPDWSQRHAPIAKAFHTGECEIRAQDGMTGEWPDYDPTPGTLAWSGPASAQELSQGDQSVTVVDSTESIRLYRVSITLDTPTLTAGNEGHVVTFTKCPDDPDLVGRPMTIVDIQHGTTNWTRDLICKEVAQ